MIAITHSMRAFIFAVVLASAGAYLPSPKARLAAPRPPAISPRATTTTSQFGRRYFDGSYHKEEEEKWVCPMLPSRLCHLAPELL